ncbi:MAG: hypothetical protein M3P06_11405 [Acidobacteriota bacterium]|nr:hypothetical protein [Acidobacteriota bacterium]
MIIAFDGALKKVYMGPSATLDVAAGEIVAADIATGAVTKTKLAGGFLKFALVDGQDETSDTTITVTGIAVGDELAFVGVLTTKASIASIASRALTDFTVSANTLTIGANPADNTNNQYFIIYLDLT